MEGSDTSNRPITCKAAVCWRPGEPLSIESITVDPPKAGEVRVKILYASVCQSDEHSRKGRDNFQANYPCILGHEAAGVVESVGPGVERVRPGEHVIPIYSARCESCATCSQANTNLCPVKLYDFVRGCLADGTTRFRCADKPLSMYMGTSTFSEYTVLSQHCVAVVDRRADLSKVCLLGCGLAAGYGAAANRAQVSAGQRVLILGLGTVGLAAAVACRERGALQVTGLDRCPARLELAKRFGCTDLLNSDSPAEAEADGKPAASLESRLRAQSGGAGYDVAIECVGNTGLIKAAYQALKIGSGKCVVLGLTPPGQTLDLNPSDLVMGRTLTGCTFGDFVARRDIPRLVDRHLAGQLFDIEPFITHRLKGIESLNEAFDLLIKGESLRCVVEF